MTKKQKIEHTAEAPQVSLHELSKRFGDFTAVNRVSLEVTRGEIFGFLGPNGAGKSTLIHMMSGFLPPSSGGVSLDGATIWKNQEAYRQIGLVPERESMYDFLTGWEFVLANAELHGLPAPGAAAARWSCWTCSTSASAATAARTSSPAASSSASPLRALSP